MADDIKRLVITVSLERCGRVGEKLLPLRAASMLEGLWSLGLEVSQRGDVSRPAPGPVWREPGESGVCAHSPEYL